MHSPARRTDWVHVWFVLIVHHHFSLSLSLNNAEDMFPFEALISSDIKAFPLNRASLDLLPQFTFRNPLLHIATNIHDVLCLRKKSDFCLQMSQGFIKTSSRLRKYGGMPSNFRYKTHKTELFWEWSRDWKVDWMDKAGNSSHYLAGSSAWLRRHNINCA